MVTDLTAQLDAEQARRTKIEHLLEQLLRAKSGRRSEQLSADQLALFAVELESQGVTLGSQDTDGKDDDPPTPPSANNRQSSAPGGRRPLPGHLKRERILHDLAEAEKHCASCAEDLREIGEETRVTLQSIHIIQHHALHFQPGPLKVQQ